MKFYLSYIKSRFETLSKSVTNSIVSLRTTFTKRDEDTDPRGPRLRYDVFTSWYNYYKEIS